jgi:ribose-phosphate pyrophosphokinase
LSQWLDGLLTFDPHLHRHKSLSEIYSIPTQVLHAQALVVEYIRNHLSKPLLIGPDQESRQWVEGVAQKAECPFLVLTKERLGDREVRVSIPEASKFREHRPVLVDDIISTGQTLMETARHLQDHGLPAPVCIGVHAVFSGNAWQEMQQVGIEEIVTTNAIAHPTNQLDLSPLIIDFFQENGIPITA